MTLDISKMPTNEFIKLVLAEVIEHDASIYRALRPFPVTG